MTFSFERLPASVFLCFSRQLPCSPDARRRRLLANPWFPPTSSCHDLPASFLSPNSCPGAQEVSGGWGVRRRLEGAFFPASFIPPFSWFLCSGAWFQHASLVQEHLPMDYPVLLALLPVLPADSCDSVWVEEPMREDSLPSRRHAAMSFARGKEVEPMSQAFFFPSPRRIIC